MGNDRCWNTSLKPPLFMADTRSFLWWLLSGPIYEAARHVKQHYGPRGRIVKHFNTNKIDAGSVF